MKVKRVKKGRAWVVTGDPLPPPSGPRWQSPAHHSRCHRRRIVWPDERFYWTFLDPTKDA